LSDVDVNMTGGYDPTETPADSRLVKAMVVNGRGYFVSGTSVTFTYLPVSRYVRAAR
jgi:hypothetical protein